MDMKISNQNRKRGASIRQVADIKLEILDDSQTEEIKLERYVRLKM